VEEQALEVLQFPPSCNDGETAALQTGAQMPDLLHIAAAVYVAAACIKLSIPTKAELAATRFSHEIPSGPEDQ
jgi:hypothetical protein